MSPRDTLKTQFDTKLGTPLQAFAESIGYRSLAACEVANADIGYLLKASEKSISINIGDGLPSIEGT
jgi:hypothetical protein